MVTWQSSRSWQSNQLGHRAFVLAPAERYLLMTATLSRSSSRTEWPESRHLLTTTTRAARRRHTARGKGCAGWCTGASSTWPAQNCLLTTGGMSGL